MIVIGIILVLLGLALGAFVVAGSLPGSSDTDVSFSLLGLTVETSVVVVFALGAVTLLLLELGLLILRSGARKSSKRRAELQRLRRVEAEVQARQASDSQRNATTAAAAAPAAPAPFARRDPAPSTRPTGSGQTSGTSDDTSAHRQAGRSDDATGSGSTGSTGSGTTGSGSTGSGSTGSGSTDRS